MLLCMLMVCSVRADNVEFLETFPNYFINFKFYTLCLYAFFYNLLIVPWALLVETLQKMFLEFYTSITKILAIK
jgi:hypothetical protein